MRALGLSKDPVDLTGGRGESFSQDATSSSPRTNAPTAAEACDSLHQLLSTYIDSEEEDGAPSSQHTPSTAGPSQDLQWSDGSEEEEDVRMEKIQRSWIAQIRVQAGSVGRSAEHL